MPTGILNISITAGSILTIVPQSHTAILDESAKNSSVSMSDKYLQPLSSALHEDSQKHHLTFPRPFKIFLDTTHPPKPILFIFIPL